MLLSAMKEHNYKPDHALVYVAAKLLENYESHVLNGTHELYNHDRLMLKLVYNDKFCTLFLSGKGKAMVSLTNPICEWLDHKALGGLFKARIRDNKRKMILKLTGLDK